MNEATKRRVGSISVEAKPNQIRRKGKIAFKVKHSTLAHQLGAVGSVDEYTPRLSTSFARSFSGMCRYFKSRVSNRPF